MTSVCRVHDGMYLCVRATAFDGPHLEFKMAGVVGPVRGRVVCGGGVFIIVCVCMYNIVYIVFCSRSDDE